jgi:hypothetical protein
MAKVQTSGKCLLCKETMKKASMTRHFAKCLEAHKKAAGGKFFHVKAEGAWAGDYWLHLAVPADATLRDLDDFLRDIWLECCGHLSAFDISGTRYEVEVDDAWGWEPPSKKMTAKAGKVFSPGLEFGHEYDYGSTTELKLKVIAAYEGQIGRGVELLARNDEPLIPCSECGEPAVNICTECMYDGSGWLCEEHSADHECGDDMFLPVVNSPRCGVCGYEG